MNADEIVKALREECKDCSERHSCDAGHPLLYCPNREAADLITSQQAEIDRLTTENEQLRELSSLAVLAYAMSLPQREEYWDSIGPDAQQCCFPCDTPTATKN